MLLFGQCLRWGQLACLCVVFSGSPIVLAKPIDSIHFLIPAGPGGGWDSTARGVGEALTKTGLITTASFENMSGGSGSRAMSHLIETARRQTGTLMVNSTPIVEKYVRKIIPQSYRDLTPVASVIADYGALVVKMDSPYKTWSDVVVDYKKDPRNVKVAGGSAVGSTDHLVAAFAFKESGGRASEVRYIPYNGGGHAMIGLLSGETHLLSTGVSEAIVLARQKEVRIIAVTAAERLKFLPETPTLVEQGKNVVFANWRGFFGAPGISEQQQQRFWTLLKKMAATDEWQRIRDSRGWVDFPLQGQEFSNFLEQQETVIKSLITDLGLGFK